MSQHTAAKPTYYNGRRYPSRMEARFAERLDLEKRAGIVKSWTPQFRVPLEIPDPLGAGAPVRIGHHAIDFLVEYANGETHAIETKGRWFKDAKLRRRVLEATWLRAHPEVRYRVITKLGVGAAAVAEEAPVPMGRAEFERARVRAKRQQWNGLRYNAKGTLDPAAVAETIMQAIRVEMAPDTDDALINGRRQRTVTAAQLREYARQGRV